MDERESAWKFAQNSHIRIPKLRSLPSVSLQQKVTNQWCYHPERRLLQWLSEFHEGIEELVEDHRIVRNRVTKDALADKIKQFKVHENQNFSHNNLTLDFEDDEEPLIIKAESIQNWEKSDPDHKKYTISPISASHQNVENLLKHNHSIHDLENNPQFNVFCAISEALDIAHSSQHVSLFQQLDLMDSVAKLNAEILNNAMENLEFDQLEEYYLYDTEDNKSLLIEHISETCHTGFRYWDSLLEHAATDQFLNKVTPTRKFNSKTVKDFVWSFGIILLMFIGSPFMGLPLGTKFQKFVTVYPDFYFISCGQSFYMILGILLFDYSESHPESHSWQIVILWWFLLYLWCLKCYEEIR